MTHALKKSHPIVAPFAVLTALLLVLSSCMFTGIENTGHIKLSKDDIAAEKTVNEEDKLMESLSDTLVVDWRKDKPFLGTSDRVKLIFLTAPDDPFGKVLYFSSYEISATPTGRQAVNITFLDSLERRYVYQKELQQDASFNNFMIPMMVDLDIVASANKLLKGKTVWPRTRFWDNPEDFSLTVSGSQFVPVEITEVLPGNADFPIRVVFADSKGKRGSLLFNPSSKSSRSFGSQFFLSDPRSNHKAVTDEKWQQICQGIVSIGMTKQEVRLTLGSPDEVESGHDYSKLIEFWRYSTGTFLRFEDGILVFFRK